MKTMCKIAGGVLIALTVFIGGCVALLGAGVEEAQNESDKTAITQEQYESVGKDDTLDSVKADFGEPEDRQDTELSLDEEAEKYLGEGAGGMTCIYYNREGELASVYQFCFDGAGDFQTKASY